MREFFSEDVLKKQVQDKYEEKIKNVDVNDDLYFSMLENLELERDEKVEAVEAFSKSKKRGFDHFHSKKKKFYRSIDRGFDGLEKKIR